MNSKSINHVTEADAKFQSRKRHSNSLFVTILEKFAEMADRAKKHQNQMTHHSNTQHHAPGSLNNLTISEKQRLGLYHFME